jgi:hypothetical protein
MKSRVSNWKIKYGAQHQKMKLGQCDLLEDINYDLE